MELKKMQALVQCKCPACHKGKMFNAKGNPLIFKIPRMNDQCVECGHRFIIEPGFFFGAMYVSYALAVAKMIACFIIFYFLVNLPGLTVLCIIASMALLTSTFNYRLSRSIWVYIFYKEKP